MSDNDTNSTETGKQPGGTMLPMLTIDWARYGRYLENADMSDEDKRAFIETLWSIMVSFVDLGFRLSPVQEICGEVEPLKALAADSAADMLELPHSHSKTAFKESADGSPARCGKGAAHDR